MMRLVTVGAVVFLCGFAAIRGLSIVGFALAEARSVLNPRGEDLHRWQSTRGLAGAALSSSLSRSARNITSQEQGERLRDLALLLVARPFSSTGWLSLAGARVTAGAPIGQVLSALRMSHLTGPNERGMMLQRGIFGLLEWEKLTDDIRTQTAHDLASAVEGAAVSDQATGMIQGVLAAKPQEVRAAIAAALISERLSPQKLARLGL
jgi:hypothetical protein